MSESPFINKKKTKKPEGCLSKTYFCFKSYIHILHTFVQSTHSPPQPPHPLSTEQITL